MKTLLIIKSKTSKAVYLFAFILCFATIAKAEANVISQDAGLTLKLKNKTVKEALTEIEKKSEYIFIYSDNVLDSQKRINIDVTGEPIEKILENILKGTNTTYSINNRQIIISKDESRQSQAIKQRKIIVSGIVKDEDGEVLPGVSIVIKDTQTGTISDGNGRYSIDVSSGSTILVFSCIGFKTEEIKVNNRTDIDVTLKYDVKLMDDVVVTALGIKRETKSLGYGVQEIKGNALTEARESNVLNSLSGRLAGVNISQSGNGPMGSSSIIIRGNNSITGNNSPLIIVDGVPLDNFSGGAENEWGDGADRGNGLADVNPDDIESVSVLKGAAAAALYGSRAGNGVIMITTKTGSKKKGLGINYTTNLMFEKPLTKLKMQNQYGQGSNGVFGADSNYSWGAKMDGQEVTDWTEKKCPYSAKDNSFNDFLETGVTLNNSISVNTATDKVAVLGNVSYMNYNGVVPGNRANKLNMSLRTTFNLLDNLSLDVKINYVNQNNKNRPKLTGNPENPVVNYLIMPRSVHYSDLEGGADQYGNLKRWTTQENNYIQNPYWTSNYNKNNDSRDRFFGFSSLQYQPLEWLSIRLKSGMDMYWNKEEQRYSAGTPFWNLSETGSYRKADSSFKEMNNEALITARQNEWWGSKFSGNIGAGGNMMYRKTQNTSANAGKLAVPDFHTVNGAATTLTDIKSEKAINSIYALAQISYDNWVYLDLTARNDWTSTLNPDSRSFFYPSAGLGWVISDMLRNYNVALPQAISFIKLRASYAEVGNDTDPYSLLETFSVYNMLGDINAASPSTIRQLYELKSELIKSTELGFDFRFFNDRLGIDFSWYKKSATNQIINLPVSSTTGKKTRIINAGQIDNKGIEIILRGTPVQTRDFTWDVTLNYARNKNGIKELHPQNKSIILGSTGLVNVTATESGSYGDLYSKTVYKRNEQGKILIDAGGLPITENSTELNLGNYNPKWTGSIANDFKYKNFSLGFLIDIRWGGKIFAGSLSKAAEYGTGEMTLAGRDEWYAGTGGIIADGVHEDGTPNTTAVNPQAYWNTVKNISEEFIYSTSAIRLREVTFGYTLPQRFLTKTPISSAKISLVGRNLWLIKNDLPGIDPESSFSTGNAQGIEYASMPSFRNIGFNLNVTF